jgi:mRNA interferase MazF
VPGVNLRRGAVVVVELDPTLGHEQHGVRPSGPSGLAKRSFALIDHLRSIDKRRIRRVFGALSAEEMAAIDEGLAFFLGIGDRLQFPGSPPV